MTTSITTQEESLYLDQKTINTAPLGFVFIEHVLFMSLNHFNRYVMSMKLLGVLVFIHTNNTFIKHDFAFETMLDFRLHVQPLFISLYFLLKILN